MRAHRGVEVLQWLGFFVAPAAWISEHLIGQGVGQVACSNANATWGLSNADWQIVLIVVAGSLILLSLGAAIACYLATKSASYEDPAPAGRVQLFSIAAMTTNVLLLVIVVLDGTASLVDIACRGS
jgi:hypothetical protein